MDTAWRLIPYFEACGLTQMAVDEWLLEQHRLKGKPPVLRFYTWQPIAISLGYHQYHYPDSWHTLRWHGQPIDLVRRPSGGRAVLHQGDLTYSLVTSGHRGRRRDIYAYLCRFLVEGWHQLDVPVHLGAEQRYQRSANCFGTSTAADLVMNNGYKLVGSAQLYRDHCILQHGSIRLQPDPYLVKTVFGTPIIPPTALANIALSTIIGSLTEAAQKVFGITFKTQPLSQQEVLEATTWAQAKLLPIKHR
ncbi:MAG: biotin/lipoate A/B protein ligase family protein [Cyanobacteria bacterium P01_H01_bin.21]